MAKQLKFGDDARQALAEPVRMLAYNSGIDSGLVLSRIEESKDVDYRCV